MTSLTGQMGLIFAGRLAALVLTFATPLVLARLFTTEEFGLYKQIFLLQGTLSFILGFGLPASLYYVLPPHPERRGALIRQTCVLLAVLGGVGAGAFWLLEGPVARWLNTPALVPLAPAIGALTLLMLIGSVLDVAMITAGHARLASVLAVLSEAARALLLVGGALLSRTAVGLAVGAVVFAALRVL